MKKIFFICLIVLFYFNVHSQKIIDNPKHGMSTLPGNITKIELSDTATMLHFHVKYKPGRWISIPKKTFIQDVNGGEKLFVTKTEGIPLGEKYTIPESGEVSYKLFFPGLDNAVSKFDYGEDNDRGTWFIYDIVAQEQASLLPLALQGDWLSMDGSNEWKVGLYADNAIVDRVIWNYKSVEKKKIIYTIVLEKEGTVKTLYAKINKDESVGIGTAKDKLIPCSLEKTNNPGYVPVDDEPYSSSALFSLDSVTYSGIIKGYTPRSGKKTGIIHVNNIFTGNQDSYTVPVSPDGSFSVKFISPYPQVIFTRMPHNNSSVFVEPGKESFQLINPGRQPSLFMGDCARINTDLSILQGIRNFDYRKISKHILDMPPEEYKAYCLEAREKDTKALDDIIKKQFISKKALQVKKLDIEYSAMKNMLSYEMNIRSALYKAAKKNGDTESSPPKEYELKEEYYEFISTSSLQNELAVLSSGYKSFINRLMFVKLFRAGSVLHLTTFEAAKLMQASGIGLSAEEWEMAEVKKTIETPKMLKKNADFMKKYGNQINVFIKKHMAIYQELMKQVEKPDDILLSISEQVERAGKELTTEEHEMCLASKTIRTGDEMERSKAFAKKYALPIESFNKKYLPFAKKHRKNYYKNFRDEKMSEVFGIETCFAFDVITAQTACRKLESEFMPYADEQLADIQKTISHPFVASYISIENKNTIAKIEANKSKKGFVVHDTPITEADKLFDSIMVKFRGKVVYVDFWATWCGPCRSGIKRIAPLKEEMKDEDVAFVYITNQTSPEKTYNNMIPDIKGEHFRVTPDEWNYLVGKFNISGIPHYSLVNTEGEIVKYKMGHNSNEKLKKIIEEQMSESL